jgi:bacillithiol biosynthesis cysteine-adding enzyme BshC
MVHSIALRDLPSTSALFVDLWDGAESYRRLVPRHFLQPGAFTAQAKIIREGSYRRDELVALLRDQNEKLNAGPLALTSLARLAAPDSVVIIGGQQAGLLGGPLYTVHKALTILQTARRMEKELGVPVVPVFWIASEDSDVAEIDHTWVSDRDGELRQFRIPRSTPDKIPVSTIRLGDSIGGLLDGLAEAIPDGGSKDEMLAALRGAYTPGRTYPQAFGAWMAWLFREEGLVLVDPSDVRLKRMAQELFEREIREKSPVSAAVIEQTARLKAAGYEPQIELREGFLTLFYQDPARDAISVRENGFELKSTGKILRAEELCATLQQHPEKFTPNAVLRPLFQDTVFPVLGVVLGPAEIVYYSQLTLAYERLGVRMPILLPRASLTLIEEKTEKHRVRLGVGFLDVIKRGERVIDDILSREVPASLSGALSEGREQNSRAWTRIIGEIDRLDSTLHRTVELASGRTARQFDFMERKIAQAARKKNDILRGQVRRLVNAIAPQGGLQERTICAIPFLARHGKDGLRIAAEALDPFAAEHRVIVVPS